MKFAAAQFEKGYKKKTFKTPGKSKSMVDLNIKKLDPETERRASKLLN